MTGTAGAQALGFALSPVISRLYSPSDFGVFGAFGAVAGVIMAAVTLEYSQAIMLPKSPDDAVGLFVLSCVVSLSVAALCTVLCVIAPDTINGVLGTSGVWSLILLVLLTLTTGVGTSLQAWCIRLKAFTTTSFSQICRSVASNVAKVSFGFVGAGELGLIVSTVIGEALAGTSLVRTAVSDLRPMARRIRFPQLKALALEYIDFPLYSASQNVINRLSLGLPVLLLTQSYGTSTAGAYAFAVTIVGAPLSVITGALRQVLFQKACEAHHDGNHLFRLFAQATLGLFGAVLIPTAVIFFWAPLLFATIFGSQWFAAGEFSRWLVLWLALGFCNLPAVLFARIIRIQRAVFIYDLLLLAARVTALGIGGAYLSDYNTIAVFSMVGFSMNIILIFFVGQRLRNHIATAETCS